MNASLSQEKSLYILNIIKTKDITRANNCMKNTASLRGPYKDNFQGSGYMTVNRTNKTLEYDVLDFYMGRKINVDGKKIEFKKSPVSSKMLEFINGNDKINKRIGKPEPELLSEMMKNGAHTRTIPKIQKSQRTEPALQESKASEKNAAAFKAKSQPGDKKKNDNKQGRKKQPQLSLTDNVAFRIFSNKQTLQGTAKIQKRTWPFNLKINSFSPSDGSWSGEISWTAMKSVHKVEGMSTNSGIRFKETQYLKKGHAVLGGVHTLELDNHKTRLTGTWALDNLKLKGSVLINLK